VFSWATKSLLGLGMAALAAAVVYGVAANEGSATSVLAFTGVAAIALGLATLSTGSDRPPVPAAEGPVPHYPPAGRRPMYPSIFPLAAALAVGVLAVGAATNAVIVVPGLIVTAAALLGWLFQTWTEHPVFSARFGARLSDRLLVPLGLPVAVFSLVLIIALSLSRVLLALPESGSRAVALAVAVVILGGGFIVASQERVARAALSLLCVVAFVAVVGAGAAGLAHGERHFEKKGPAAAGAASHTAKIATNDDQIAFDVSTLDLVAAEPNVVSFDNQSHGIPHNVGIYDKKGGSELFAGKIVTGPGQVDYQVPAMPAGTYYFQCDVHPAQMFGTVTVAAATTAPTTAPTTAGSASGESTTAPTTTTTLGTAGGLSTTATTVPGP